MTREEARRLQDLVNAILDDLKGRENQERLRMGTINWGDLKCCDIEERRSLLVDDEQLMIAVVIDEASPDAVGLQNAVGRRLEAHGYKMVYVQTEW